MNANEIDRQRALVAALQYQQAMRDYMKESMMKSDRFADGKRLPPTPATTIVDECDWDFHSGCRNVSTGWRWADEPISRWVEVCEAHSG